MATTFPQEKQVTAFTRNVVTPPRFVTSRIAGEMSVSEWLRLLQTSPFKYDYVEGRAVQVAGASIEHNMITTDTMVAFALALRAANAACELFNSDQKVYIHDRLYYFPDFCLVCGVPQSDFAEALRNPTLIAETSSPTTEQDDRTDKFRDYTQIASLQYYLLIDQNRVAVTLYEKGDAGKWVIAADLTDLSNQLTMVMDGKMVTVPLADIYRRVAYVEAT